MADIINFRDKSGGGDNLIAARPLEFRRGDRLSGFAFMCSREESSRLEAHRTEALRTPGHRHISFIPDHITLDGGYHYTLMGLFRHRSDQVLMRRVYRLAGMMECVIKAPSPILRTDLLRRFYSTITEERDELKVVWRGNVQEFLLPIRAELYDAGRFHSLIAGAGSLKELYLVIQTETDAQFDILSRYYVFYVPERLVA